MLTAEQKKAYQREYMKKKRSNNGSNILDGSNIELVPSGSNKADGSNIGLTELPKEWQNVVNFISRDIPDTEPNKMSYCERLQRIAGGLGKSAGEVWFGGLTMEEVGDCIGTLPGVYSL